MGKKILMQGKSYFVYYSQHRKKCLLIDVWIFSKTCAQADQIQPGERKE